MIHLKINMREDFMEYKNLMEELYSCFEIENPNPPVNLNLIGIAIKGNEKFIKQGLGGMRKCYECSSQTRGDVYHFNNEVYKKFCKKPIVVKHAKELNILADYFYNF